MDGLDLDQHGGSAHPEYVISTLTASHAVDGGMDGSTNLASVGVAGE